MRVSRDEWREVRVWVRSVTACRVRLARMGPMRGNPKDEREEAPKRRGSKMVRGREWVMRWKGKVEATGGPEAREE